MMNKSKEGITVAGSLIADIFYETDTYPIEGFLTTVRGSSFNIGGSGNLILDLAKLDPELTVKVCAIVGDDKYGMDLLATLKKYPNIDIENITVEGDSSVTMVINAKDTKQRTFFFVPGASDVFNETYIEWDNINTKIFHLEYLLLMKQVDAPDKELGTHAARILKAAHDRGMITSVDVVSEQSDRVKSVVTSALKYTDICCINESEAAAATGLELFENGCLSAEKVLCAVKKIQELGVSKWVVIHAPECGFGYDCESGEFVNVESLKLPDGYIKGSTGAGDAYCGGILYGFYKGNSLTNAMRLARACAVCSLSENNGTDGMRSAERVLQDTKQFANRD